MNDIAASIGLANLELAECAVEAHRANAAWYGRRLAGVGAVDSNDSKDSKDLKPGARGVGLPPPDPGSAWWSYTLLVPDRDRFIGYMQDAGIECSPVHERNDRHTAFQQVSGVRVQVPGQLPGVDRFAAQEVAIPVGWWLSVEERERVAEAVSGFR